MSTQAIKVSPLVVSSALAAVLALQAWMLKEIVGLKASVAGLQATVQLIGRSPTQITQR